MCFSVIIITDSFSKAVNPYLIMNFREVNCIVDSYVGGITPEYVIREILSRVPVPALGKAAEHDGNAPEHGGNASGGKAPDHD